MDYRTLTDTDLEHGRIAILAEQERRANLAQIPAAIQELAAKYADGGGDREALENAINLPRQDLQ